MSNEQANKGIAANGEQYFHGSKYPLAKLVKAADAVDGGASIRQVMADQGISYSPVWNFTMWRRAQADGSAVDCSNLTPAKFSAVVVKLHEAGCSWGTIMVRTNRTEGQVRRAYTERTNIQSQGTRIGKGGRYLADEQALYEGTAADGTQFAKAGPRLAVGETIADRLNG